MCQVHSSLESCQPLCDIRVMSQQGPRFCQTVSTCPTAVLNVKEMKRRNTHDSTWDILGHRPDACAKVGPLIARA